jgi:hypothetical protein
MWRRLRREASGRLPGGVESNTGERGVCFHSVTKAAQANGARFLLSNKGASGAVLANAFSSLPPPAVEAKGVSRKGVAFREKGPRASGNKVLR